MLDLESISSKDLASSPPVDAPNTTIKSNGQLEEIRATKTSDNENETSPLDPSTSASQSSALFSDDRTSTPTPAILMTSPLKRKRSRSVEHLPECISATQFIEKDWDRDILFAPSLPSPSSNTTPSASGVTMPQRPPRKRARTENTPPLSTSQRPNSTKRPLTASASSNSVFSPPARRDLLRRARSHASVFTRPSSEPSANTEDMQEGTKPSLPVLWKFGFTSNGKENEKGKEREVCALVTKRSKHIIYASYGLRPGPNQGGFLLPTNGQLSLDFKITKLKDTPNSLHLYLSMNTNIRNSPTRDSRYVLFQTTSLRNAAVGYDISRHLPINQLPPMQSRQHANPRDVVLPSMPQFMHMTFANDTQARRSGDPCSRNNNIPLTPPGLRHPSNRTLALPPGVPPPGLPATHSSTIIWACLRNLEKGFWTGEQGQQKTQGIDIRRRLKAMNNEGHLIIHDRQLHVLKIHQKKVHHSQAGVTKLHWSRDIEYIT
ncbi:hypothetical protein C8J55DRAFT_491850 [Lentinula edodes]|uniref:Uncharacterized protein n=1 Tax=Lentinula lateritia TaxID=40482 RepID=A0A9W8ZYP2_9AGAR|nr:hypothetical protein C8J55DRAFT_491850 [Lentinula edodes]